MEIDLTRLIGSQAGISTTTDLNSNSTLFGIDCEICGNTGRILRTDEAGVLWTAECRCMKKRRTLRNIRNSGIADMCSRYTFESYTTPDAETRKIIDRAKAFSDGWFFIYGRPGSGKTHICIAICNNLLQQGREVRYMLWRETAPKLKSLLNTEEYTQEMTKLKSADVLYIDDIFKGTVSEADLNLAFELLNARYNDSRKLTIISGEKSLEDILSLDEAVGSRIYERSKGFCLPAPGKNWRFV